MKRLFFALGLGGFALLAGCGGADFSMHRSDSGEILETYLPADVDQVFSYSLREDGQWNFFKNWSADLPFLPSSAVSSSWSEAFPERYRVVWTLLQDGESPDILGVATLASSAPVNAPDGFEKLSISGHDIYHSKDQNLSVLQVKDLLLFSSSDEYLLSMADRDFDENLWDSDLYQDALRELGPERIFYWISYRSLADDSFMVSFQNEFSYESLGLKAETGGFGVDSCTQGAPELDFKFNAAQAVPPYLFNELDSKNLMAYGETYDLATQIPLNGDVYESVQKALMSYFSLDFSTEVAPFLSRGAAVAVYHEEGALIPEFTVMIDVKDDPKKAEAWLAQLDTQLGSVVDRFSAAIPGSMTRGTVLLEGENVSQIHVDTALVAPDVEGLTPLTLTYGMRGDRLILSTHDPLTQDFVGIAQSELYQSLSTQSDVHDGLILAEPVLWAAYLNDLTKLKELFGVGISDSAWATAPLLEEMSGLILSRSADAHHVHWQGFLSLKASQ